MHSEGQRIRRDPKWRTSQLHLITTLYAMEEKWDAKQDEVRYVGGGYGGGVAEIVGGGHVLPNVGMMVVEFTSEQIPHSDYFLFVVVAKFTATMQTFSMGFLQRF